jgi:hypothetical protein
LNEPAAYIVRVEAYVAPKTWYIPDYTVSTGNDSVNFHCREKTQTSFKLLLLNFRRKYRANTERERERERWNYVSDL